MTKFELMQATFEFDFMRGKAPHGMTAEEVFDRFMADNTGDTAKLVGSFDTEDEALKAFNSIKHHADSCYQGLFGSFCCICGTVVYVEVNEYDDEDGEWLKGGDVLTYSAADYIESDYHFEDGIAVEDPYDY